MIARNLPFETNAPTRVGTRSGRTAAQLRHRRSLTKRRAPVGRIFAVSSALTLAVVAYLALMANVMRLSYELNRTLALRAQLADRTTRLEDQVARLESRDRLATLAARLHMHEPAEFVAVTLPTEHHAAPQGIAFLPWLK